MTPRDEKNFLVEITPEIMDELNRMYMHSDTKPITELYYSPYWKSAPTNPSKVSITDKGVASAGSSVPTEDKLRKGK